jgi:hypothetical protein
MRLRDTGGPRGLSAPRGCYARLIPWSSAHDPGIAVQAPPFGAGPTKSGSWGPTRLRRLAGNTPQPKRLGTGLGKESENDPSRPSRLQTFYTNDGIISAGVGCPLSRGG